MFGPEPPTFQSTAERPVFSVKILSVKMERFTDIYERLKALQNLICEYSQVT